jgi:hypothetical protein
LEQDLKLFIENMKKVRYNDVPLAKDIVLTIPKRVDLYQSNDEKPTENQRQRPHFEKQNLQRSQPQPQPQRVPSANQSLDMLRKGLSVSEIAVSREISETTIATHLAEFVLTGELPVSDLIPPETIAELTPRVQAAIAEDNLRLAPIKEAVGERFSYSDIRFVMNHCLYERDRTM